MTRPAAPSKRTPSRREFLGTTLAAASAAAAAGPLGAARFAHAAGDDTIKIALIGCGGRGTGAASQALKTSGPVKLVAMADLFSDRLELSLRSLQKSSELAERIDVPEERKFLGFDAFHKAIDAADLVLLTTPPQFRPMMYDAAIKAGKHVFMEKPCCVDGPGFRQMVETNKMAQEKKLSVGVGLQRHHQANYIEGIKRIRDGAAGEIFYLRTYFNMPGGGPNFKGKPDNVGEMEWQIRRWTKFAWLSGDHIVEQAVHEIDIANWVMDGPPVEANGLGGRQVRIGAGNGDIFDHHCVEYVFEGGIRHFCQARQIGGTWAEVSDNVHGSKGLITLGSGPYGMGGPMSYRGNDGGRPRGYTGNSPYQQEHDDLFASVRGTGPHLFEGDYGATSSMTAVLGRMATYSGKVVTWQEAVDSELSFAPKIYSLDADPPAMPDADGNYPIAMPGVTKAW